MLSGVTVVGVGMGSAVAVASFWTTGVEEGSRAGSRVNGVWVSSGVGARGDGMWVAICVGVGCKVVTTVGLGPTSPLLQTRAMLPLANAQMIREIKEIFGSLSRLIGLAPLSLIR